MTTPSKTWCLSFAKFAHFHFFVKCEHFHNRTQCVSLSHMDHFIAITKGHWIKSLETADDKRSCHGSGCCMAHQGGTHVNKTAPTSHHPFRLGQSPILQSQQGKTSTCLVHNAAEERWHCGSFSMHALDRNFLMKRLTWSVLETQQNVVVLPRSATKISGWLLIAQKCIFVQKTLNLA